MENVQESVQKYYGQDLNTSSDLKTNACCTQVSYPNKIKQILGQIHDEVMSKYYGCGLTIPNELEGLKILDLGSGSGRDCFLASKLVGPNGYVIGVDMTDEQLAVAEKHISYHTDKFGYTKPNVTFKKGQIENLDELNISSNSLDLIISNCVINLSVNKPKVLKDCYNLLKQGGEMYFSDVYVNKRITKELASDPVIYGECLGGALYWNDFYHFAKEAGFTDPRIVEASAITVENVELQEKLSEYEFYSVTYRLFKMDELEKDCEDYGQAVVYKGTLEGCDNSFTLDHDHTFEKGKVVRVCGNTFSMLQGSRFKKHFEFIGDFNKHYGIFPGCGTSNPFQDIHKTNEIVEGSCC